MAADNLSNSQKLRLYSALFQLNRGYKFIFDALHDLRQTGIFKTRTLYELQALSKEMQSETNHALLETMHDLEEKHWAKFGKVRDERDKWLRG